MGGTINGPLLINAATGVFPPPTPPGDVLAIAIQALNTIAAESLQAVTRLEGLRATDGPVPINPATTAAPVAAPIAPAAMAAAPAAAPIAPAAVPAATVPNGPTARSGRMNSGEVLHPGDSLTSSNGNYVLAMQTDGNLVLYSGSSALWASNTWGKPVAVCIMRIDGNLVLYDPSGNVVWQSTLFPFIGAHLEVQNDGNVVIYMPNETAVWATNTVYTVGSNTLIYRSRLKRWTNIPFFGTKGNDVILVKLPAGATLKSVSIAALDANGSNPDLNSPVGTEVGSAWAGVRLTNVQTQPGANGLGFVAIGTHWWFSAFSDAEYSISVWATGPTAYPVEDNGTLLSANMDRQIVAQTGTWFENGANLANLLPALAAVASVCVAIASGGAATPVAAAIIAVVASGGKVLLNPSGK